MFSPPLLQRRLAPVALLLVALLTGCGTSLYLGKVRAADEKFQEAEKLEAHKYAPYEYYGAEIRLAEARRLAAEAEYGMAMKLADEAKVLSGQAVSKSKEARQKTQGSQK